MNRIVCKPVARRSGLKLPRRRLGQTTTEYGLVLAILAIGLIGVIIMFRNNIKDLFTSGGQTMAEEKKRLDDEANKAKEAAEKGTGFNPRKP